LANLGKLEQIISDMESQGADANVTKRALTLGAAQDSVTGFYPITYEEATVKMVIQPKGASLIGLPCGYYASYNQTGFTVTSFVTGDQVKDKNNVYYTVKTVTPYWFLNLFSHYVLELETLPAGPSTLPEFSIASGWSIGPGWSVGGT
jgi:hypothetical protein